MAIVPGPWFGSSTERGRRQRDRDLYTRHCVPSVPGDSTLSSHRPNVLRDFDESRSRSMEESVEDTDEQGALKRYESDGYSQ